MTELEEKTIRSEISELKEEVREQGRKIDGIQGRISADLKEAKEQLILRHELVSS